MSLSVSLSPSNSVTHIHLLTLTHVHALLFTRTPTNKHTYTQRRARARAHTHTHTHRQHCAATAVRSIAVPLCTESQSLILTPAVFVPDVLTRGLGEPSVPIKSQSRLRARGRGGEGVLSLRPWPGGHELDSLCPPFVTSRQNDSQLADNGTERDTTRSFVTETGPLDKARQSSSFYDQYSGFFFRPSQGHLTSPK